MRSLEHIYRLGVKELYSLRHDPVLVFLILYTFTFAIYTVATGVKTEVRNASIAIVDEDGTELSRPHCGTLAHAILQAGRAAALHQQTSIRAMDAGRYAFVVVIPPNFRPTSSPAGARRCKSTSTPRP